MARAEEGLKARAVRRRRTRRAGAVPAWLWVAGVVAVLGIGIASLYRGPASSGPQPIGTIRTADKHSLVFSPVNDQVAFFGHHDGVLRTTDGGRTWTSLRVSGDAMGMAIHPANPEVIYFAGHDVFRRSTDGGATWQAMPWANLPGTDIHGFAISPDDPDVLFAFVAQHGLFRSDNAGVSWHLVTDRLPGDTMVLAAASGTPPTLYAGTMQRGVVWSTDGGNTWQVARSGAAGGNIMGLAVDPRAPNRVYAGGEAGLFRSDDRGGTWQLVGFARRPLAVVAVSPANPRVLLVVDMEGRVYRSGDGGTTWSGAQ